MRSHIRSFPLRIPAGGRQRITSRHVQPSLGEHCSAALPPTGVASSAITCRSRALGSSRAPELHFVFYPQPSHELGDRNGVLAPRWDGRVNAHVAIDVSGHRAVEVAKQSLHRSEKRLQAWRLFMLAGTKASTDYQELETE